MVRSTILVMVRGWAWALAGTAVIATGCGTDQAKLPRSCLQGPAQISVALGTAPGPVRLYDGTRLSTCVRRAREDAQLQEVGAIFTRAADGLATQVARSDAAALRLGYLVAATRRGASTTNGVAAELMRHMEQTVGLDGPPAARRGAFEQGLAAGKRSG
jgi:hypothetical protein